MNIAVNMSFSLYTQQWYMSYRFCCVYSEKTTDDGHRNCPKPVEFYSKNKFEILVHLVGFIIGIYIIVSHVYHCSMPLAAWAKAWVCVSSLPGITGLESRRGNIRLVSCEYCVLSGRGLCTPLLGLLIRIPPDM